MLYLDNDNRSTDKILTERLVVEGKVVSPTFDNLAK
jgi:hypothetical protein